MIGKIRTNQTIFNSWIWIDLVFLASIFAMSSSTQAKWQDTLVSFAQTNQALSAWSPRTAVHQICRSPTWLMLIGIPKIPVV